VATVRLSQMNQNQLAHAVRIAFSGRGEFDDRVDHHVSDAVLATALEPEPLAHLVGMARINSRSFGSIALPVNGMAIAPNDREK
jgi:hypothetical protein